MNTSTNLDTTITTTIHSTNIINPSLWTPSLINIMNNKTDNNDKSALSQHNNNNINTDNTRTSTNTTATTRK